VRLTVLLLDEVDVFFGDGFYGSPYIRCVDVDHPEGFNLICSLWQKRDGVHKTGRKQIEETLMSSQEVRKVQQSFPNFSGDILKRCLVCLVYACVFVCALAFVFVCVFVFVCGRARAREKTGERQREKKRE